MNGRQEIYTYAGAFHFADGADETVEYEYDENGNMTKDLNFSIKREQSMLACSAEREKNRQKVNRNISSIEYNLLNSDMMNPNSGCVSGIQSKTSCFACNSAQLALNLPSMIEFEDQSFIRNTYSAAGEKPTTSYGIRFAHVVSPLSAGNAGGEAPQGGIVIPGDGGIPGDDPGVQPYKYGGKELDRTSGLDAYDFGARSYFADRLQWSTMDPLCEKYYDVTPYGYCHNDPVNKKDINGMDDLFDMNGFYICDTGAGRNVVIVNGNDFSLLSSFNYDNQYNKNMLINVASYYLKQSDFVDFSVSINSDSDNEVDATLGYHILEDSYLVCVDNGKLNPALDDKYNFQSIADHESIHRYDKSMHNESIGEVLTIIKQAKAPSWEKTSIDYKYSQAQYAMNCLNKDLHNLDFQTAVNYVDKLNEAFGNVNTFMLLPGRVSSVNNLNENVVRGHKR